jgi:DUF4097 and DUF4098 domain-containing protein YvlB
MVMSRNRKLIIVGALIAIEVLLCVAVVAVLATARFAFPRARFFYVADTHAEEIVEESFSTDGQVTLDLTNSFGDVQITAGDGDRFVVKAVKEAWGQDKREAEDKVRAIEVKMTMDGETLRVEVKDPDRGTGVVFGSMRSSQVSFEIVAPRQATVVVHTSNGPVTLKGTEGDADLTSRFGAIAVEDVSGGITVDTSNGDVTIHRSGGESAMIDLHSNFGSITVRQVTAKELILDSSNGTLDLKDVTVGSDLTLNTRFGKINLDGGWAQSLTVEGQNGDITVNDVHLDGALDLSTNFGQVSVARTEAREYKIETHNGDIELDDGHGSLWLHSGFGDISVEDTQDARLDLKSENGKVSFAGSLSSEADHVVESDFGAVSLRLPSNTAFTLDASTNFGNIRCEFDVLVRGGNEEEEGRASGDDLRGTINGGGPKLRIKTRNGDITIEAEPSG